MWYGWIHENCYRPFLLNEGKIKMVLVCPLKVANYPKGRPPTVIFHFRGPGTVPDAIENGWIFRILTLHFLPCIFTCRHLPTVLATAEIVIKRIKGINNRFCTYSVSLDRPQVIFSYSLAEPEFIGWPYLFSLMISIVWQIISNLTIDTPLFDLETAL